MMKEDSSKKIVAIVLARGGSKGIPGKNITPFCGRSLLRWTLDQLRGVPELHSTWVSSDDDEILNQATAAGCFTIRRPMELSGDEATSESGWCHALDMIGREIGAVDLIVGIQVTSPIRHSSDISGAIQHFWEGGYDSVFSASPAKDLCLWSRLEGDLECLSYDKNNPNRRRQNFAQRWIENGSFYLFTPGVLLRTGTRFGSRIGIYPMEFYKMFEIDEPEDLKLCEVVMQAFLEGGLS